MYSDSEASMEESFNVTQLNKNAIIYCRLSSAKQSNDYSVSADVQEQTCRKFLREYNLRLNMVCKETTSGYRSARTVLTNILKSNKNKTLVVYDVSRFSRNVAKAKELLELAKKKNINIVFVSEMIVYGGDLSKELKFYLKQAQKESENLGRRVRDSLRMKRDNGYHTGGAVPYGYDTVKTPKGKKLVPNKSEMKVVDFIRYCNGKGIDVVTINRLMANISDSWCQKDCIKCYSEDGDPIDKMKDILTAQEICDLLNDYDVTFRNGENWTASRVKSVINRNGDILLINLFEKCKVEPDTKDKKRKQKECMDISDDETENKSTKKKVKNSVKMETEDNSYNTPTLNSGKVKRVSKK